MSFLVATVGWVFIPRWDREIPPVAVPITITSEYIPYTVRVDVRCSIWIKAAIKFVGILAIALSPNVGSGGRGGSGGAWRKEITGQLVSC